MNTLPGLVTPDIDVHAGLTVSEAINRDGSGRLSISGSISGDQFPSTEAFVVAQSGKHKVLLGVKYEEGGVSDLAGDN